MYINFWIIDSIERSFENAFCSSLDEVIEQFWQEYGIAETYQYTINLDTNHRFNIIPNVISNFKTRYHQWHITESFTQILEELCHQLDSADIIPYLRE